MKALLRLYPAAWRKRYGDEFEALIEDANPGWRTNFDLFRGAIKMQFSLPSFPKLAAALSIAGVLAGLGVSHLMTPRYESTSLLKYSGDGIGQIIEDRETIMSRGSLAQIIADRRLNLYASERKSMPMADAIDIMRKNVRIAITPGAHKSKTVFSIAFTDPDRYSALGVVRRLTEQFIEADGNRIHERGSSDEQLQMQDQIRQLQARLSALERNAGLPPSNAANPAAQRPLYSAREIEMLDPPSSPEMPIFPNRSMFMIGGFASGIVMALAIAIFRRKINPMAPLPA